MSLDALHKRVNGLMPQARADLARMVEEVRGEMDRGDTRRALARSR